MVTIELYHNYSEPDVLNKHIEWVATLNGTFRNGTSINNPIVDINSDAYIDIDFDVVTSDNLEVVTSDNSELTIINDTNRIVNINYIYISEFNRYYYVTDVTCVLNKLYAFNCHVDGLMTSKNKLLNMEALIERNEFLYYDEIEDNKMAYEFYQDVEEHILTDTSEINFNTQLVNGSYAIAFVNEDDMASYHSSITSPTSVLPDIKSDSIGVNKFVKYGVIDGEDLSLLVSQTYNDDTQLSFIASLIAFPFEIPHNSYGYTKLKLGSTEYNSVYVYYNETKTLISKYYRVASIDFRNYFTGSYMDYEPYTKYELYLPFYDYIELKSADIKDSVVDVYYSFDFTNGCGKVNIVNGTKKYIIKSVEFTCGIKIAINRNNLQQLNDERTQMSIKGTLATIGSASALIGGIITANPLMAIGGVMGLGSSIGNIAGQLATQHEKATASNNSGFGSCYTSRDVRLKLTRTIKREPNDYAHYYGKPTNQTFRLGDLTGYTLIKDIHLNDLDITKNEIDELYNILTSGIIL